MPKEATKAKVSSRLPTPPSYPYAFPSRFKLLTLIVQPPQTRKAAGKSEKTPRGGSRKKDPKAPKRALSAYMYFSQDWRERMKQENPEASFGTSSSRFFLYQRPGLRVFGLGLGELGKLLGNKWKELDDDEKKVSLYFFDMLE
jgi:hypothetical protein